MKLQWNLVLVLVTFNLSKTGKAYLVGELSSKLVVLDYNEETGELAVQQTSQQFRQNGPLIMELLQFVFLMIIALSMFQIEAMTV